LVASADRFDLTPLHLAAQEGHKAVAELLIANKADVNTRVRDMWPNWLPYQGWTPLHMAAANSCKDVVELLLAKGADVNAKTDLGLTPLDLTRLNDRADVAELLVQHGGGDGIPGVYEIGFGVKEPVALFQPFPPYTDEARRANIAGIVVLKAIIRKDGTVDNIKVCKGLGYKLDESAINTVSKWRFQPGTLNGKPVDVIAKIETRWRN
jgi:TonB family protein